ncbi:MAG: hypothetical protein HY954_09790 [Deltaproteobacteria bacterium]|nr:hypothetical protein [Deltaproteobacteria bacterium]
MKYFLVSPGSSATQKPRPFYWSLDNGEKWIGVARSIWREKHEKDVIVESAEAQDLTELDWTKTPFHNDTLTSGWLSRDGRFYGCPQVNHDVLAYCVLGIKVGELEQMGWVRVYDSSRYTCEKRLSPEQANWLSENGYTVYD